MRSAEFMKGLPASSRRPQAEQERDKAVELEREQLEQARESVRAGRFIPDNQVDAWLDRLVDG